MNQRMLQTLTLLGLMLFLAACQSTTTPMSQTPTPQVTPSPIPTQTLPVLPPISTQSTSRTVPATPTQVSPPTPIPSPTAVYQNAFAVAFSADGLSLVFNSSIDGLVPEDQNHVGGAFIYHTENGSIQRVRAEKEDPLGKEIPWRAASLSANGRYLLFGASSNSSEPAADHYNFTYLRDLSTGQDERIDLTPFEKQFSTPGVSAVSLSPDGRYLALEVVSDRWSIYLLERSTGRITPISVNPDKKFTIGDSNEPVFSPEGHYLAFVSTASNLVPGDEPCSEANPNCGDVFIYEIATNKLQRIPAQIQFSDGSPYPYLTVSNNARWLAWTEVDWSSPSLNLVVRLFDRSTGKMETVCAGVKPFCSGHSPSISVDGRWLAFSNGQVYLSDHQTGQLTLVSADAAGAPGNGQSGIISLQQGGFSSDVRVSGDGRFVAFSSQAANLLPAGAEKRQCFDPIIVGAYPCYDLIVYDRQTKELNWIN